MLKEQICRAIFTEDESIRFESVTVPGSTLADLIEADKQFGTMIPRNGEYFTYRVMDWEGKWISNEEIRAAVTFTWNKAEKVIDLEFREAKDGEYADFKVYFRRTINDVLLTANTLMYQFYPIANFDNPNRGVCVVNIDFPWSVSGDPIPLHIFDPYNYTIPTIATAKIFDFDAIYEHEGPGHGMGLPHSPNRQTKMFGNESDMAESMFDEISHETEQRLQAKYPKAIIEPHTQRRWIAWFKATRDRTIIYPRTPEAIRIKKVIMKILKFFSSYKS